MPRPQKCRFICQKPLSSGFCPCDRQAKEKVVIGYDEFETVRLLDYEGYTQADCAKKMNVARTTVTRMYDNARRKIADALVNSKMIEISGGDVAICSGPRPECRNVSYCCHKLKEDKKIMKIAVTYEDGNVFAHFGHSEHFKLYDIEDKKVISSEVVDTNGSGHGALAGFLRERGVDTLICGGIGGGAKSALAQAGIELYCGVTGKADEAVEALLAGTLNYNPDIECNHHAHSHGEGHSCGHNCSER